MDHAHAYLLVCQLFQRLTYCLYRALYVRLYNNPQLLHVATLNLVEQIIQRYLLGCLANECFSVLCDNAFRKLSCLLFVCRYIEAVTSRRNLGKPQNLNRSGGTCGFHASALIICHRSDSPVCRACNHRIAHTQRTALYQYGCNRAASLIQLCFDDSTSCLLVGVCLQLLHFCCQNNHFQQVINAFLRVCRYRNANGCAAPVLCQKTVFCQLLLYTVGVCGGLIHLVDGNDDFNACCLRMVDCFYRLGHYAVIRRNNQNRDICNLRAAHTHCRKCLVTGCIQEGNGLAVNLNGVCTDMLCNAACFALCYAGMTDGIQQRGFAVVNMPHYNNNGRSFLQLGFILFLLCAKGFLHDILFFLLLQNHVVFLCDGSRGIKIQCCIDGKHFALFHQIHNQIGAFFAQNLSQILYGNAFGNIFDNGICVCFLRLQCRQLCHQCCFLLHFTSSALHGVFSYLLAVLIPLFVFFVLAFIVVLLALLLCALVILTALLVIIIVIVVIIALALLAFVSVFVASAFVSVVLFLRRSVAVLSAVIFLSLPILLLLVLLGLVLLGCILFRCILFGFFLLRLI